MLELTVEYQNRGSQASCFNSGSQIYLSLLLPGVISTDISQCTDGQGKGKWSEVGVGRSCNPVMTRQGRTCRGEGILWESLFCLFVLVW